ncbi:hypothetical protein B0H11DRAFT_2243302 [Mycena galericulata]|nr:hypothetical protein B0H11DRAFT_2243302 [Mycena galericulata]
MSSDPGSKINPLVVGDSPPNTPGVRINTAPRLGTNAAPSTLQPGVSGLLRESDASTSSTPAELPENQVCGVRRRSRHEPAPFIPRLDGSRPTRRPSSAQLGRRTDRLQPLTLGDVYKNGVGPLEQLPVRNYHKCGICHMVKSHPVSYTCGHSHCYACIRVWLERKWTCPECVTPMHRPPFRHYGEEAWIADAYPEWENGSEVDYSWDGLRTLSLRACFERASDGALGSQSDRTSRAGNLTSSSSHHLVSSQVASPFRVALERMNRRANVA